MTYGDQVEPTRGDQVGRWYLSRRWLVLHAIALLTVAACARLGWWQLERSVALHEASRRPVAAGPAQPAAAVLPASGLLPRENVGRLVHVAGQYDESHQLLVRDRPLHDRPGYLVLTPLRPAGATGPANDPAVAVVRGWVPAPADGSTPPVPPPPDGQVQVTGWVAGPDPVVDGPAAVGRPGEVSAINPAVLVNAIPYPMRSGYVHVTASTPAEDPALTAVPRPLTRTEGSWPAQNLTYVAEWWAFGAAAIWFWVVWLRQDAAAARRAREDRDSAAGGRELVLSGSGPASDPARTAPAPRSDAPRQRP
jgi:cytochrome oxidase assembly protein ShyY1